MSEILYKWLCVPVINLIIFFYVFNNFFAAIVSF